MPRTAVTKPGLRRLAGTFACGALLCACVFAAGAGAANTDALQTKVESARAQANALAADLRAKQSELAAAEAEAAGAAAREEELSGLLADGQERAVALGAKVDRSERRLVVERGHLHRARGALAERLVAIYESGSPSSASFVLASSDYEDLVTGTRYLQQIEESDTVLARRVEEVRNAVRRDLKAVAELKARVEAYNDRLAVARSQIVGVRQAAEVSASQLESLALSRKASLATLKSSIGGWVGDIQAAKAAAAERASTAEAQTEVDRWLGGPYSIPTYIVICESGGNYGALNPSSGAGGAYQILPSTWQLYGGKGNPEDAPKAEQDAIAAEIWADSGAGAWVCAG